MVAAALSAITSMFSGGAAAAGTAATTAGAATTAAATASSGLSIGSILQGTAGVLSAVATIGAANQQAQGYEQAANDAKTEQRLETLQGISRRTSIKQAMMDQVGQQDVAYAASGTDLSFGTPNQARKEAFRQADLGIATEVGTEQTRVQQLSDREKAYRRAASRARTAGWIGAATSLLETGSKIAGRGM